MNDDSFSNYLCRAEAVCQNRHVRAAVVAQQGRQVSCVAGVLRVAGIVMSAGLRKVFSGTTAAFVDMKGKEAG